jgi:hypothetical protein
MTGPLVLPAPMNVHANYYQGLYRSQGDGPDRSQPAERPPEARGPILDLVLHIARRQL